MSEPIKLGEREVQLSLGFKQKVRSHLISYAVGDKLWYTLDPKRFLNTSIREALKSEVKNMDTYEYGMYNNQGLPKRHAYYFPHSDHNFFCLQYLIGNNLYKHWRRPIEDLRKITDPMLTFPLMEHQKDMVAHTWMKRHSHLAAEQGLGKSLTAIQLCMFAVAEWGLSQSDIIYVGPRSAKKSFELEIKKWKAPLQLIHMFTYEGLTKHVKFWTDGTKAPRILILDESSKIKNMSAARSQAVAHTTQAMRDEYQLECLILPMSGTPAPGKPEDWWSQAHITRPGFLIESSAEKLKKRLSISMLKESPMTGTKFYDHVTYLDDPNKCKHCGAFASEHLSTVPFVSVVKADGENTTPFDTAHAFEPSINEVSNLSQRLDGLTLVKRAEDCLDLPPISYRTVRVKPDPQTVAASKLVKKVAKNASSARAKLLQLSDGFNYTTTTDSMHQCELCKGSGHSIGYDAPEDFDPMNADWNKENWTEITEECPNCLGEGEVPKYERAMQEIICPKDDLLLDLLDEHADIGRFVVFSALTGSLEKIQSQCIQKGWAVLRLDGTGWRGISPSEAELDVDELLQAMDYSHPQAQEFKRTYSKVVVVANAKSASMGLTLTASPSIYYYSNSYDAEARMQSEKRIHRLGGRRHVTIIDVVHLGIDKLVKANLDKKTDLQSLTMGELFDQLDEVEDELRQQAD